MVKVVDSSGCLLEELATSMTCKLVQADLDLERGVPVFLVKSQICFRDEGNLLVGHLGAQDVALETVNKPTSTEKTIRGQSLTQAHILEAILLPDVIIIGAI